MRKILAADIEQGMVLAKPVRGPKGNVLLNAGALLQSGMANRLQSWGIPVVYVEGDSDEEDKETTVKKVDPAEVEKRLSELFVDVRQDPIMQVIYREAFAYLIGKDAE
jgi:hypothetical protein